MYSFNFNSPYKNPRFHNPGYPCTHPAIHLILNYTFYHERYQSRLDRTFSFIIHTVVYSAERIRSFTVNLFHTEGHSWMSKSSAGNFPCSKKAPGISPISTLTMPARACGRVQSSTPSSSIIWIGQPAADAAIISFPPR